MIALLSAYKVAKKATVFNFEAVYSNYKKITSNTGVKEATGEAMSKNTFLKVFLDLVEKGFLKCENETDILNVNNKISLGFRQEDLEELTDRRILRQLDLPRSFDEWLQTS